MITFDLNKRSVHDLRGSLEFITLILEKRTAIHFKNHTLFEGDFIENKLIEIDYKLIKYLN